MADDSDDGMTGLESLETMSPAELKSLLSESEDSDTKIEGQADESVASRSRPKKSKSEDDYSDLQELDLFGSDGENDDAPSGSEEEMTSESARKKK